MESDLQKTLIISLGLTNSTKSQATLQDIVQKYEEYFFKKNISFVISINFEQMWMILSFRCFPQQPCSYFFLAHHSQEEFG